MRRPAARLKRGDVGFEPGARNRLAYHPLAKPAVLSGVGALRLGADRARIFFFFFRAGEKVGYPGEKHCTARGRRRVVISP